MDNERDFKGVWIPKAVWLDERLNALDKVILIEIDSLDQGDRGCYASNKHLAGFCQCSESKVSKAVSKLIKYGYIYVQNFDGRQRELKSSLSENAKQPSKIYYAESENMPESNTKRNTETKKKKESYNAIVEDFTENGELRETIFEYIKMRKLIKAPMTDRALLLLLHKLQGLSTDTQTQIAILNQAIVNNWKSVYPLKGGVKVKSEHEQDHSLDDIFHAASKGASL